MNTKHWKMDHNITVNQHQITFSHSFNKPLGTYHIVDYCTNGTYYDDNTQCLIIPFNVTTMIFGDRYNNEVFVPLNINVLQFGRDFNKPIILGLGVEKVIFGKNVNSVIVLNRHVTELKFGYKFNQPIFLNKKLKELALGFEFNRFVLLNHNLEQITIRMWNRPQLKLGPNVKKLILINDTYVKNIFFTKRIVELKLFNVVTCVKLPKNLKYLMITVPMVKMVIFGKGLRSLKIFNEWSENILSLEKTKTNEIFSIQICTVTVVVGNEDEDELADKEILHKFIVENLSNGLKCINISNQCSILDNLPNDFVNEKHNVFCKK